jgi:hypothetical protein
MRMPGSEGMIIRKKILPGGDQDCRSSLSIKSVSSPSRWKNDRNRYPETFGRVSRAFGGFPESGEAPQADREYFSGKDRENEEPFILHYPVWFGVARTMKER